METRCEQIPPAIPHQVIHRHAALHNLSSVEASRRSEELAKFLLASTYFGESLVPSPAVDDIWHDFILDTMEYQRYCTNSFGYLVHHRPQESTSPSLKDRYERTLAVMHKRFGPLDRQYWPEFGAICDGGGCKSQ